MNMPKVLRKHIYLDDSTVPLRGLDFSGFHLRMAYHNEKKQYDEDPYVVKGYGLPYRDHFKKVALVAINATDRSKAIWAIKNKLFEDELGKFTYWQVESMLKAFEDQHKEIKNYINSDYGLKAMYCDSMMIEDCLKELLIKQNIIV